MRKKIKTKTEGLRINGPGKKKGSGQNLLCVFRFDAVSAVNNDRLTLPTYNKVPAVG